MPVTPIVWKKILLLLYTLETGSDTFLMIVDNTHIHYSTCTRNWTQQLTSKGGADILACCYGSRFVCRTEYKGFALHVCVTNIQCKTKVASSSTKFLSKAWRRNAFSLALTGRKKSRVLLQGPLRSLCILISYSTAHYSYTEWKIYSTIVIRFRFV